MDRYHQLPKVFVPMHKNSCHFAFSTALGIVNLFLALAILMCVCIQQLGAQQFSNFLGLSYCTNFWLHVDLVSLKYTSKINILKIITF